MKGQDAHSATAELFGRLSDKVHEHKPPRTESGQYPNNKNIEISIADYGFEGAAALKCLLHAAHYRAVVCDDEADSE